MQSFFVTLREFVGARLKYQLKKFQRRKKAHQMCGVDAFASAHATFHTISSLIVVAVIIGCVMDVGRTSFSVATFVWFNRPFRLSKA
jgi:hypothetical protein